MIWCHAVFRVLQFKAISHRSKAKRGTELWYLNLLPLQRAYKRIKNKSRYTHKRKPENSHQEGGVGTGCSFTV